MDPKDVSNWYSNYTGEPFMDELFPGSVLVIDAEGDNDTRSIGSSNILEWKKRGMRGVVTSGGLADSDEIIHEKVPAYHKRMGRGFRPGRNEIESVNRPVTLGGVLVRPGDVVMADGDGVVVVPREHARLLRRRPCSSSTISASRDTRKCSRRSKSAFAMRRRESGRVARSRSRPSRAIWSG